MPLLVFFFFGVRDLRKVFWQLFKKGFRAKFFDEMSRQVVLCPPSMTLFYCQLLIFV